MPSHTFQYRPGFYISVFTDVTGKESIDALYSPTGYGYEWIKGCKTVAGAKRACTKYGKLRVVELWESSDDFTKAYIECALWSSNDESDESGGNPLDQNYDWRDIALPTMEKIISECKEFQSEQSALLALAYERYSHNGWSAQAQAGHDFWLTRNGHGAGFWDRQELEDNDIGEKLTGASQAKGERNLYVARGKIYQD